MSTRPGERLVECLALRENLGGTPEEWSDLDPGLAREIDDCSRMETELSALSLAARGLPERAGPFHLLRPLGEGPAGPVYLGEHEEDGARAAVRLLWGPAAGALREAARGFLGWRHAAAAAVLAVGEDWIATEHTGGVSLAKALAAARASPPSDPREVARPALRALAPVGRALGASHAMGRFHGGVSPRKIDLAAAGSLRLRDFGFDPTLAARPPTPDSPPMGSTLYLAPEQAGAAGEVGPATDVHSLAAVAFAVAAGVPPVNGRSLLDVLRRIREGEARSLADLASWAPPDLVEAVDAARRPDPAERVARLDALVEALERV